jgi:hypothetical protein
MKPNNLNSLLACSHSFKLFVVWICIWSKGRNEIKQVRLLNGVLAEAKRHLIMSRADLSALILHLIRYFKSHLNFINFYCHSQKLATRLFERHVIQDTIVYQVYTLGCVGLVKQNLNPHIYHYAFAPPSARTVFGLGVSSMP